MDDNLQVVIYDDERKIYLEITNGFLIKEIDDAIYCFAKLINDEIVEISDIDKQICDGLKIRY